MTFDTDPPHPSSERKTVAVNSPGDIEPRCSDDASIASSPASTGPAGPLLEGHVGAQYLLPLLSGGEARGLPGISVTHVAFQRAGLNHPLDDVIVTGRDARGYPATLELQAKRTISFTASNRIFADVVALACQAAAKPNFETTRYELAVAIARTSTRIEQHIQDVLKWAREYQDAAGFFGRLNQSGAAHRTMREFVEAFRGHMSAAGAAHDDAAVRKLLSRFQVLAFDFEQPGSVCAQLARERCALLLEPPDAGRAGELWDSLQQIALQVDAAGGDLDASALRERLTSERGYRLAGSRHLHVTRERLAETSENALDAINSSVHGVAIDRGGRVAAALSALEQGRYLEIRGAGGVGKSGVLKDLALRVRIESRIVVVAPHHVPGGGWSALAAQLGCEVTARDFLTDLAGDGGGVLFIDGLDRFDDLGQQTTIADLIRASAQVRGFRVVVTVRLDFDSDARAWLPTRALQELGEAPPLLIGELDDDEVTSLRDADPSLAALLRPGHPAEKLVRNLYRLDRLAHNAAVEAADTPFSEAQMAWQWWTTGDGAPAAGRLDRRRVLRSLAVHSLASSAPIDTGTVPGEVITALAQSGSLRILNSVHAEPAHDVLRDWAIGCLLYDESEHIDAMMLESVAPARLVRGMEFAARLHAEYGSDAAAWQGLLSRMSVPGVHGSWRRAVLLALTRSERAGEILTRCLPALAADNAALLSDLVRAAITVDSQLAAPLWAALGVDTSKLNDDFVVPRGPTWPHLIAWSLAIEDYLPHAAVPQFVDLYSRWCSAFMGQDALSTRLVGRLYAWLVQVEARNHPSTSDLRAWAATQQAPGLAMTAGQENDLRQAFLLWCKLCPVDAEAYLQGIATHPHRHVLFRRLLQFVGTAPHAAPQALADLFLKILCEGDSEDDDRRSLTRDVFSAWDLEYFPASPARAPFLDLLQANKEQGLRLVRGLIAHAVLRRTHGSEPSNNGIEVPFPCGRRSFPWYQSYMWSRSQTSGVAASALMALEAWAHQQIENNESVQAVIDDILGPEGSPAAYLLVAVDVMLSHWPKTRAFLWPFASSAKLLAIDRQRFAHDVVDVHPGWVRPEPAGRIQLDDIRRRPSRRTPLDAVLNDYGWYGPDEVRDAMQQALQNESACIGAPDGNSSGYADPKFAAMCALNCLDTENYIETTDDNGQATVTYVPPTNETQLLAELQRKSEQGNDELTIRTHLMQALTGSCCSEKLLERAVRWATQDAAVPNTNLGKDEQEWIERTRLIVAALVMRDGSTELKAAQREWARAQLAEIAMREPDERGIIRQLPFNLAAIAAVGLLAAYRNDSGHGDLRYLLNLAARHSTNMVSVLNTEIRARHALRPELVRSLVRLGFASSIYAVPQRDDYEFDNIDDYQLRQQARESERKKADQLRLQDAVTAELTWLSGNGPEPKLPDLPDPRPPRARRTISLGKARAPRKRRSESSRTFDLDAATAAQWLSVAMELWRADHPDLLCELVQHCWRWTAVANGVGCGPDEEPGERAHEWNSAYFAAALAAAVSVGGAFVEEHLLAPLAQLPDERFLDAAEAVLHALDQLWLNNGLASDAMAISIREAVARRLVTTRAWHRLASERSVSTELHLAGAVAAMFMGQHEMGRGPHCYVLPAGANRAYSLLPILMQLTEQAAGSTFVAMAFLGFQEIEPHTARLEFMARAVAIWWQLQGANAEFWIDYGIGRRVCDWIDKAVLSASISPAVLESSELTGLVDILLQCGSPSARALEERLIARRKEGPN